MQTSSNLIPQEPTCEDIQSLVRYLPILNSWNSAYAQWITNTGTFPYPEYIAPVTALFTHAGEPQWCDYGYKPAIVADFIQDDKYIANASLHQIKSLLTFCVRGERFTDGHWERMLKERRIHLILQRLQVIYSKVCVP